MASIDVLPVELITFVVKNLGTGDLAAFARTSRKFFDIADPALYKLASTAVDFRNSRHPLRWAAEYGQVGTLRKTLAAGVDPNMKFEDDASRWNNVNSYEMLAGAIDGRETGTLPPQSENHELYNDTTSDDGEGGELLGYGVNYGLGYYEVDPLAYEFQYGGEAELIANNVSAGPPTHPTFQALHAAAAGGHDDVIEILLDNGALIDALSNDFCYCRTEHPRAHALFPANVLTYWEDDDFQVEHTPLHVAICQFRKSTVEILLEWGASIQRSVAGLPLPTTALHTAASTGQADLCRLILDQGHIQDPDILDREGLTPFYWACFQGHWNTTVPFLLERGADIDFRIPSIDALNSTGRTTNFSTVLFEACAFSRYEDAIRLVHLGANVNKGFFTDGEQVKAPLHAASGEERFHSEPRQTSPPNTSLRASKSNDLRRNLIQAMIQAGAEIDVRDSSANTPLHLAARYNIVSALRSLLVAGANVQSRSVSGRTPLMECCLRPWILPLDYRGGQRFKQLDLIRLFLDHGSRINTTDNNGNAVLHLICEINERQHAFGPKKLTEMVRLLLDRGAKDTIRNRAGETPFHIAFKTGHLEICDILLRRRRIVQPMRPDELNSMLETAIDAVPVDPEAFRLLYDLDFESSLWTTSKNIINMVNAGHFAIADAYLDRKSPPLNAQEKSDLLHQAIRGGNVRLAKRLLAMKSPVTSLDRHGRTPLYNALSYISDLELDSMVEELLLAGADAHFIKEANSSCMTPLQMAISTQKLSIVELMLRHQPLRDRAENLPNLAPRGIYLHTAARKFSSRKMFSTLIRAGAEVTELDSNGDTPLSVFLQAVIDQPQRVASTKGMENTICSTIRYLYSKDIDIHRKNMSDKSIASYLAALKLYHGNDHAKENLAKNLKQRIQIVPAPSRSDGKDTLYFEPLLQRVDTVKNEKAGSISSRLMTR